MCGQMLKSICHTEYWQSITTPRDINLFFAALGVKSVYLLDLCIFLTFLYVG